MEKFPLKGTNISTSATVDGTHPLSGDHPSYQAVGRKVSNLHCLHIYRDSWMLYHRVNEMHFSLFTVFLLRFIIDRMNKRLFCQSISGLGALGT